jgi:hypothetical protein
MIRRHSGGKGVDRNFFLPGPLHMILRLELVRKPAVCRANEIKE